MQAIVVFLAGLFYAAMPAFACLLAAPRLTADGEYSPDHDAQFLRAWVATMHPGQFAALRSAFVSGISMMAAAVAMPF
jgi:hypothetical protein